MARYYLLMRQRGEGCDYTIGCGYRWEAVDGQTLEHAAEGAVARVRERGWRGASEAHVNQALLIPAEGLLDLAPLLDADVAREKGEAVRRRLGETGAAERAKLRAKYPED